VTDTPEPLGAALGPVASPSATAFDDIRLSLADRLFAEHAAGHLDQLRWEEAFQAAAHQLADTVAAGIREALTIAAGFSRYPARRLRTLLPDDETVDAFYQRLLAEAIPLEELAPLSDDDPTVTRRRATALQTAWIGAARLAEAEARRGRTLADSVAQWRRPTAAAWAASAAVGVVALLVAAWLGGQVAAPHWFEPVGRFWWSLPWP
jgi:hypothetical protein